MPFKQAEKLKGGGGMVAIRYLRDQEVELQIGLILRGWGISVTDGETDGHLRFQSYFRDWKNIPEGDKGHGVIEGGVKIF